MINTKETTGYNQNHLAFNVGKEKDSYTIESIFKHDLIKNELSVKYRLVKNWTYSEKRNDIEYKKYVKFRKVLKEFGEYSYLDLIQIVKSIVLLEGMEINDPNKIFGKLIIYELK